MSPFEADLGYIPRAVPDRIFDSIVGTKSQQDVWSLGQKQQAVSDKLKLMLAEAQRRMKLYYDKNRPVQDFQVGDRVMVSSKNLDLEHLGVSPHGTTKFAPLWIGPYPILKLTTPDTYRLQLPVGLRLHPEFHTSLLKKYYASTDPYRLNKPNEGMRSVDGGEEESFLIEDVVAHRKNGTEIQYCVKWLGYPSSENSWEPLSNIRKPAEGLIRNYLSKLNLKEAIWLPDVRRSKRK
jgi:hypothetical protein